MSTRKALGGSAVAAAPGVAESPHPARTRTAHVRRPKGQDRRASNINPVPCCERDDAPATVARTAFRINVHLAAHASARGRKRSHLNLLNATPRRGRLAWRPAMAGER